jgi:hypothetical protein
VTRDNIRDLSPTSFLLESKIGRLGVKDVLEPTYEEASEALGQKFP